MICFTESVIYAQFRRRITKPSKTKALVYRVMHWSTFYFLCGDLSHPCNKPVTWHWVFNLSGIVVYLICVGLNIFSGILFVDLHIIYVRTTHGIVGPDYDILLFQCFSCMFKLVSVRCFDWCQVWYNGRARQGHCSAKCPTSLLLLVPRFIAGTDNVMRLFDNIIAVTHHSNHGIFMGIYCGKTCSNIWKILIIVSVNKHHHESWFQSITTSLNFCYL